MGIYHFAPIGRWPGAVTSALAHLKHHKDEFSSRGPVIDSLILFTTPEIAGGTVKAPEVVFNQFQSLRSTRPELKSTNAVDVVVDFIKQEIAELMPDGGKVYRCILDDHGDYQACFEKVARAALYFSPPGETGKQIWANLTGGTNVMNAALSFLSRVTV